MRQPPNKKLLLDFHVMLCERRISPSSFFHFWGNLSFWGISETSGRKESKVKLTWKKAMEIDVVFNDGTRDQIPLQAVSNIPGEVTPCLFSGALNNDQDSKVTVIGCQGHSEVIVEIISKMKADGILDLIISDGETYEVTEENTGMDYMFSGQYVNDARIPPQKDNVAAFIAPFIGALPKAVTLEISMKYDNSLLAEFGNNHDKVKQYLSGVAELAKQRMTLIDLRVHLKVVGSVTHYAKSIGTRATGRWLSYEF